MKLMFYSSPNFLLLLLLSLAAFPFQVRADDSGYEVKRRCIAAIEQRTAAFAAQDWGTLEKRAKLYISNCKGAFDERDLSEAQAQVAIATINLDRPAEGLPAASSSIETFYANSACHIQKVVALQRLKRLEEARRSLDIAEKLIKHNIDVTQRGLARQMDALDRELLEARLEEFNAQLEHAQVLRDQFFSEQEVSAEIYRANSALQPPSGSRAVLGDPGRRERRPSPR